MADFSWIFIPAYCFLRSHDRAEGASTEAKRIFLQPGLAKLCFQLLRSVEASPAAKAVGLDGSGLTGVIDDLAAMVYSDGVRTVEQAARRGYSAKPFFQTCFEHEFSNDAEAERAKARKLHGLLAKVRGEAEQLRRALLDASRQAEVALEAEGAARARADEEQRARQVAEHHLEGAEAARAAAEAAAKAAIAQSVVQFLHALSFILFSILRYFGLRLLSKLTMRRMPRLSLSNFTLIKNKKEMGL